MIRLDHVSKKVGFKYIFKQVSFTFPNKGIIGVIGPNGSGKTTLFKIMTNLLSFTGEVMDDEQKASLDTISFVPDIYLFKNFTIAELINTFERQFSDFNKSYFLGFVCKKSFDLNQKLIYFTKGQQAFIQIILTLSRNIKNYLLDEPFDGVDLKTKEMILDELIRLSYEEEKLILISSHEIFEIERIIEQFVLINRGQISHLIHCDELNTTLQEWYLNEIKENYEYEKI